MSFDRISVVSFAEITLRNNDAKLQCRLRFGDCFAQINDLKRMFVKR